VWKRDRRPFLDAAFLHRRLGMLDKSLMTRGLLARTDVGAIRPAEGGFGLFFALSAAISTGFSAGSTEN
jgi:hypothetical protein